MDVIPDPLSSVWRVADEEEPRLSGLTISEWPAELREAFISAGLIARAEEQTCAACEGCPDLPYQIVEFLSDTNGNRRAYLCCSNCGPYEIAIETLQTWRVEWPAFLALASQAMQITGPCREVIPGRVWRLGKGRWNGDVSVVYFVRAAHRQDTLTILREAAVPKNALLITPRRQPHPDLVQPVVVLELALTWEKAGFLTDVEYIASLVPSVNPSAARPKPAAKRGSRMALIEQLTDELREHLRAVRDHVLAALDHGREPTLLPRPTQKELAKHCSVTSVAVCRCLQDPSAQELQMLWNLSADLEGVLRWLPDAAA